MNVELLHGFHHMEMKRGFMPSFCEYRVQMRCLVDHLPVFFHSESASVALGRNFCSNEHTCLEVWLSSWMS